jgi:23S rRNA (cytidine1920-2'-O)/16S rRNA (cytidine1409-2'-O)-methyltransferase
MAKATLDTLLTERGLFTSKSAASKNIQLGLVKVNGQVVTEPKTLVGEADILELVKGAYVSRAGLKLEAANKLFKVNFKDKIVLDVGSSTGGFTDYSIRNQASKVIAIEIGSDQMNPTLSANSLVELHEKTDIRQVRLKQTPDIVLIDLSFVSLKLIMSHIFKLVNKQTYIFALVKPQFEAIDSEKNKGIVKNQKIRREILKSLENWLKNNNFIILNKVDSEVHGLKGNIERFYLLKRAQ